VSLHTNKDSRPAIASLLQRHRRPVDVIVAHQDPRQAPIRQRRAARHTFQVVSHAAQIGLPFLDKLHYKPVFWETWFFRK
jgi:hypothetical protein